MSLLSAISEVFKGFKSLLVGLRITAGQAVRPNITVQYPHQTLKMPERFRGHLELVVDPVTGKTRCTTCGLCVRACPSDCIELDGIKRDGDKKKSVTEYEQDFTKCSLCGSCVDACPSDAIQYSKDYNVVSFNRDDFGRMDLFKKAEVKMKSWAETHPSPPAPPAPPAAATVAGVADPGPASPRPATPNLAATATPAAQPQAPSTTP
jgi:NADH-quinone oxidoreductase subunit I